MSSERLKLALDVASTKQYPAFVTGSRVIGGHTPTSDWDIVICNTFAKEVREILDGFEIEESHYNDGFKLKIDSHVYNFVPLPPVMYFAWAQATIHAKGPMCSLPTHIAKEREARHIVFEGFVQAFKTAGRFVGTGGWASIARTLRDCELLPHKLLPCYREPSEELPF